MKWTGCFASIVLAFAAVASAAAPATTTPPDAHEDTLAVVVPGEVPLLHTAQIPTSDLGATLREMDGNMARIVKLNVVATSQAACDDARQIISRHYQDERPATSFVIGALAQQDARFAVDAVGIAKVMKGAGVLPPGPRVYISGQAEKGATPAPAARDTLAKLKQSLAFVGCNESDVVQVRAFLTPMSAAAQVNTEIDQAFGEHKAPVVFIEWKSDLPIEIELISKAPPALADAPQLEYLTPPGMTASPLFARIVRINRGDMIYFSGLCSTETGSGKQQTTAIFEQLQQLLATQHSDMQHLAKAIYYVSDGDASKQLNEIRPMYYDPKRPPAASKAMVAGVGAAERSIVIDMIAVKKAGD